MSDRLRMKNGKNRQFLGRGAQRDKAGGIEIWMLVLLIVSSIGLGCVIQSCGDRKERETRHVQFNAQTRQVGTDLSALEWKIGDVVGLSDEDREDILGRVRKLQTDYEGVLRDFQRIRADERAAGESRVQQLWMLDRMGNQGR